jgi:hypothetical protein
MGADFHGLMPPLIRASRSVRVIYGYKKAVAGLPRLPEYTVRHGGFTFSCF